MRLLPYAPIFSSICLVQKTGKEKNIISCINFQKLSCQCQWCMRTEQISIAPRAAHKINDFSSPPPFLRLKSWAFSAIKEKRFSPYFKTTFLKKGSSILASTTLHAINPKFPFWLPCLPLFELYRRLALMESRGWSGLSESQCKNKFTEVSSCGAHFLPSIKKPKKWFSSDNLLQKGSFNLKSWSVIHRKVTNAMKILLVPKNSINMRVQQLKPIKGPRILWRFRKVWHIISCLLIKATVEIRAIYNALKKVNQLAMVVSPRPRVYKKSV